MFFDGLLSSTIRTKSGIGQGTILGPILFIIYINDLVKEIGGARINMYADDCIIYCSGNTWEQVRGVLQQSLSNISAWLEQNALKLNVKRSKAHIPPKIGFALGAHNYLLKISYSCNDFSVQRLILPNKLFYETDESYFLQKRIPPPLTSHEELLGNLIFRDFQNIFSFFSIH